MTTNKHYDYLRNLVKEVVVDYLKPKPMFKEEGNDPIEEAEDDEMEVETPKDREQASFEEDPINYILKKYPSLVQVLTMLMTKDYKDYITGIYIIAPKPTTFRIVLHNGQQFTLAFMGKAYEAKISGKKYFLLTIGEKERAILAIARLLETGSPITTQGPEQEENSKPAGEPTEASEEVPAGTEGEEATES